jgi:hypothetical protein
MTRPLLISTMKNEAPYLLEWVAWHRLIGFDSLLVYTNDCEDGTDAMLDRLAALGLARHERNKVLKRGPQKSALKHALAHEMTQAADWLYVTDADEFLNIHVGDGSVQALIGAAPGADCIAVTWRLFSHGGEIEFRDAPVTETMTEAERPLEDGGFPDRFAKCLYRRLPSLVRLGVHGPREAGEARFVWMQPDGRRLGKGDNLTRPARRFAYEAAQVNHYAVRSLDCYLVKKDRGRANHVNQELGVDYWRRMCRGGAEDRTILRRLPALKAEIARLKEDAELARLHDEAVAWHRAKIAELRARPDIAALRAELLALVEAGDHRARFAPKRPAKEAEPAPEPRPEPRIAALCAELRGLLDHVEPRAAAMEAAARLDEIERGLFGAPRR